MILRKLNIFTRRQLRHSRLLQIGCLMGFWVLGTAIVQMTGLPIPGGIVGMLMLLILLASGLLSLNSMQRGAKWFLAEMLLFFIPAVVTIRNHPEMLGWLGLKIMAVIVLGTALVMIVTAVTVDLCGRLQRTS